MTNSQDSTSPFSFEASSATRAYDGTVIVALHDRSAVLLLKSSADAARALALGIMAELAEAEL